MTTLQTAREAGEQAAAHCLAKAERSDPEFVAKATAAILAHLRASGQASGEDLVDVAIAHGARPHEARSFGGIFRSLLHKKLIFVVGYAPRRKGHGCMGAKIYGTHVDPLVNTHSFAPPPASDKQFPTVSC